MTEYANPLSLKTLGKFCFVSGSGYNFLTPLSLNTIGKVNDKLLEFLYKLCVTDQNLLVLPAITCLLLLFPVSTGSLKIYPSTTCKLFIFPNITNTLKLQPSISCNLKIYPTVISTIEKCP